MELRLKDRKMFASHLAKAPKFKDDDTTLYFEGGITLVCSEGHIETISTLTLFRDGTSNADCTTCKITTCWCKGELPESGKLPPHNHTGIARAFNRRSKVLDA